jgi:hypothetical protein
MFSRVKRIAILSLATAAVFCGGCDQTAEADKNLSEALAQANVIGDPADAQFAGAMQVLQDATRDNVSPAIKAQAKAKLASMERLQADELLREAARKDISTARIAMQVLQAASQVQATNLQIETYKKLDPGTVKAEIQKMINAAKGGAEQVNWIGEGDSALPTEAAAQQKVSKLEGEIAQKQEQVKTLTDQRTKALEEAERFAKQSEDSKGQESVDAFKKSADARKQASDVGTQVDLINAQLVLLQKDLQIAQGQQAAASEAVKQLQDQMKLLDESWQAIQQQIAAQTALAKEIVATDGSQAVPAVEGADTSVGDVAGKSLTAKADSIKKLADESDALRDQAREKLEAALAKQLEAFSALSEFSQELGKIEAIPSQATNAKSAIELGHTAMSLSQFRLSEASIAQAIGRLNLARATSLATRLMVNEAVEPVLTQAGQSVPASLGKKDDLAAKVKEAITLTSESLKSADEKYTIGAPAKSQVDRLAQATALVQSALVRYDLHRCALLAGNKEQADKHLAEATEQIKAALDSSAYFPPLPAELAEVLPKNTIPDSTTQPSEETPATQPGEGTTPADSTAAQTPEAAEAIAQLAPLAKQFSEALTSNTLDSLRDSMMLGEGGEAELETAKGISAKMNHLLTAIETKFGAEVGGGIRQAMQTSLAAAMTEELKFDGDKGVDEDGDPVVQKVDGVWKLVMAAPTTDASKAKRQEVLASADKMEALAARIESGEVDTPEKLTAELQALSHAEAAPGGQPPAEPTPGGAPPPMPPEPKPAQ